MKNSLLLISIISFWGCIPKDQHQKEEIPSSIIHNQDSSVQIERDTTPAARLEGDSVGEIDSAKATISPELRKQYLKVKEKMMLQRPPVQHKDDTFRYNLTPEEWRIFNLYHKLKDEAERSGQFQK